MNKENCALKLVDEITLLLFSFCVCGFDMSRSRWPRGLRRGSAAARMLVLLFRSPPRALMSLCLVNGVYRQVVVSAANRSLVQRSPTECVYVTECNRVQH